MIKKNKGQVSISSRSFLSRLTMEGIEPLIYPAFFIGVISHAQYPFQEREENMRDGQFFLNHIFGGTACSSRELWGIFLPISTCDDRDIIGKLSSLAERRWYMQNEFSTVGPFELMPEAGGSADGSNEALVPFTNIDKVYSWLKSHKFRYVAEFSGPDMDDLRLDPLVRARLSNSSLSDPGDAALANGIVEGASICREISRSSPLTWENLKQFAQWLSCDGKFPLERQRYMHQGNNYVTEPAKISIAFIYGNSD